MNTVSNKLSYDPKKFVDREDALEIVLDKARRIAGSLPVERRVVIFRGQRGAGKTWLLKELERCLSNCVNPYFVDLSECEIDTIKAQISVQQRPLVLLIENIEATKESQLDELLEQVLSPLVQERNALIVLVERGRPHYWSDPAFREKSDERDLEPFGSVYIEEQVQKQVPKAIVNIADIESLGGGYPGSTYALARYLPQKMTALEHCVTLLLQGVPKDLQPYFEALSVLRAFDETRIMPLLRAYSPGFVSQTQNYAARRKVREQLVNTTLAHWNEDAKGYVLDEPLRLVVEAALHERDFELWARLHCVAHELYTEWAKKYKQSSEWWAEEKQYHADCLEKAGRNPADCPKEESREEKRNDD